MRKAFIIESFDDFWDFLDTMKEVNRVVCEDREEIDMIMENGEGTFIVLIKGRLVFNIERQVFEPFFSFTDSFKKKMAELKMNGIFLDSPQAREEQKKESDEEIVSNIFSTVDDGYDEGFEEWLKKLQNMDEEERRSFLWDFLSKKLSEDDVRCCRRIVELLSDESNSDKNTDILFIERELKKDFPEINPITVFSYVMLLQGLKMIKLEE